MEFGMFMDFYSTPGLTQNEVFREAFELVDLAEESGLDSVWLGESHFNPRRSVLSANMFGDWLRVKLDPQLKNR